MFRFWTSDLSDGQSDSRPTRPEECIRPGTTTAVRAPGEGEDDTIDVAVFVVVDDHFEVTAQNPEKTFRGCFEEESPRDGEPRKARLNSKP